MVNFFYTLLKTAVIIAVIDAVWLLLNGSSFKNMIEHIQGAPIQLRYGSMILLYIALAYMLLQTRSYTEAALFGFCIYAVYDLTNYSIFRHYDIMLALMDMAWGAVLFVISRYAVKKYL